MLQKSFFTLLFFGLISVATPAFSEVSPLSPQLSYADLADLAADTPLVIDAQIRKAIKVKPERAPDVRQGHQRFYVEARVINLVRGQGGIGRDISYLIDTPLDFRGRAPKLKKRHVLLFAYPVTGKPGSIQLVGPDAQIDWTAENANMLRNILSQAVASDAPPRITGIGNAFHVAGSIRGEGETQIFLNTETGAPVSLSILRRPGQEPRWSVALGEIVDESATTPSPNSLLWYRLACSLPRQLPAKATAQLEGENLTMAREDYGVVLRGLGPCVRTRSMTGSGNLPPSR
ncbi:hypothetical protein [Rhizorhapis sp. SPR117]|uniref:hypothetical protein n=1 Tax=Rhizorhapis sp. SPR117 TaxID=2912611 RepID=UPI001F1AADE7|nr:hypothetical protein [Rhizorhapis sp. SPR117]